MNVSAPSSMRLSVYELVFVLSTLRLLANKIFSLNYERVNKDNCASQKVPSKGNFCLSEKHFPISIVSTAKN